MVLYGGIILWCKWLVLWASRQIVLFCPRFWCNRIGLGVQREMGRNRSRQFYFPGLVIMEQSKLPAALKGNLPWQLHCLKVHQPCLHLGRVNNWSLIGNTSTGCRLPPTWCLQAITDATHSCHVAPQAHSCTECVVHKVFIHFKRHHSQKPAADAGGFMSSVDRSLCSGSESLRASKRACWD